MPPHRSLLPLVASLLLLLQLLAAGVGAGDPAELVIGGLYPLSGELGLRGSECWAKAADLAVQVLNNDSSILPNTRIVHKAYDTKGEKGSAITGTLSLACGLRGQEPGVNCNASAIQIGPCYSGNALASQPIAQALDIVQVSPTATSPELSDKELYPTFTRVVAPSSVQATVLASIVGNTPEWTHVSVLYSEHEIDVAEAQTFVDALPDNVTVTAMMRYGKPNSRVSSGSDNVSLDLKDRLTFIKSSMTYLVALFIRGWDVGMVFSALTELNMIGGTDDSPTWTYISLSNVMGSLQDYPAFNDAFAGMVGVATAPIDKTTPAHNAFIDAWTSNAIVCNNDTRTSGNTKRTYDTVQVVAKGYEAALRVAQSARGANARPTEAEVTTGVRGVRVTGVTGEIRIDAVTGDRLPELDVVFYDQSQGDQVDIGTYTPFQGLSYDLSKVIWWGGRTTVPAARPEAFTSNVVMRYIGVILSILTLLWVLVVVALTVYWRNTKLMKWSSPVFMFTICVGVAITTISFLIRESADPLTTAVCSMDTWLQNLGRALVAGTLFAKTYRVAKLFNNKKLRRIVITNKDVALRIAAIMGFWVLFLTLWQLVAPQLAVESLTPPTVGGFSASYTRCMADNDTASTVFSIIDTLMFVALLMWGAYLAYRTRKVPAGFNESRYIMLAIYNVLIIILFTEGLLFILEDRPEAVTLLRAVSRLEPSCVTLGLLFVPKFNAIRRKKEHVDHIDGTGMSREDVEQLDLTRRKLAAERRRTSDLRSKVTALTQQVHELRKRAPASTKGRRSNKGGTAVLNPLHSDGDGDGGSGHGAGASLDSVAVELTSSTNGASTSS